MPQSIMSKQDFDNIAEIHSLKALSKEAILIRVGIDEIDLAALLDGIASMSLYRSYRQTYCLVCGVSII